MDDANQAKEKLRILTEELWVEWELTKEKDEQIVAARERAKGLAAKAVEGFQQTEEYYHFALQLVFQRVQASKEVLYKALLWGGLREAQPGGG